MVPVLVEVATVPDTEIEPVLAVRVYVPALLVPVTFTVPERLSVMTIVPALVLPVVAVRVDASVRIGVPVVPISPFTLCRLTTGDDTRVELFP